MGGEPNQAYWRGIRPTDPAENIPVDIKVCSVTLPVGIASVIGNLPVDVKAHTVNTPVDVKSHAVNTPVDVKSMTGNMPVDVKAHTVNTPVDIKSHDVDTPVKDSWLLQGGVTTAKNDPAAGTVYINSPALSAGWYDFTVSVGVTVNHSYFSLEHRNTANDDNIHSLNFTVSGYKPYVVQIKNRYFAEGERLRVYQTNAITGRLVGGLWWNKRSVA